MLAEGSQRSLGDLDPARSRHNWGRSAVTVADGAVVVGGPGGRVTAFDSGSGSELEPRWTSERSQGYVVSLAAADSRLAAGTRGVGAGVSLLSPRTGGRRWTYAAADAVGTATADSILAQPYVVDVGIATGAAGSDDVGIATGAAGSDDVGIATGAAGSDDVVIAAIRRHERRSGDRSWSSVVLGFDPDGSVRWRHRAAASPVALDTAADRVAVAYNRRPAGGDGVVVLDAVTGDRLLSWDPDGSGDRRVGDVAFLDGDLAAASHADKRGYRLAPDGTERWRVDLGTPKSIDNETVYTYPTHVCAADGRAVFVTGNTFAAETRDPDARHPGEHTVTAVEGGEVAWSHGIGGFARDVSSSGSRIAVPSAQHFRQRDADTHAVHVFDARRGHLADRSVAGIASSAAIRGGTLAAVEEPVAYHDEDVTRGTHRLHTWIDGGSDR